ncbi:MAG TPA: glucose-6-phosphate isomerase [Rhodocyclaceae bacterium]|nr:glucose-6-phosphate isomerase [Rhodocyclaceae bacterium]
MTVQVAEHVEPQRALWQRLGDEAINVPSLRDLFATDPGRAERMDLSAAGLHLNYSRQRVTPVAEALLLQLAAQCDLESQRDALFSGAPINGTEGRSVLHVALRGDGIDAPWGATVDRQVQEELGRFCAFADALRQSQVRGWSDEPIRHVVNLGIGGSDLGPRMASEALAHLADQSDTTVRLHYVSNPDAWALHATLKELDPRHTLFLVSSKTFTTQETLTNAASARRWLADAGCPAEALHNHFAAITASPAQSQKAGYGPERTFLFWDWVGGRYSVWSAIGLPLAIAIGSARFKEFLAGARAMDKHFRNAPLARNLPVIAALMGVWNRNLLQAPSHLIVAYASRLRLFTPFIQQMDMESNGKGVQLGGDRCDRPTGPIVWGGLGIDGQHAYFQLVHQGHHRIPVDFIGVLSEDTPLPLAAEHHRVANANLLAQARALAFGRSWEDTYAELRAGGMTEDEAQRLASHRAFAGDVPSNLIWLDRLDAAGLGALIAFYEHKVFVQATLWGINAYDQWGVELGKKLVHELHPVLCGGAVPTDLDPATRHAVAMMLQQEQVSPCHSV